MCKKAGRPDFAVELKTQNTKQLRRTILNFFQDLGIADVEKLKKKTEKQLEAFARKKHWEAVVFLSDSTLVEPQQEQTEKHETFSEGKRGGMMGGKTIDLTGGEPDPFKPRTPALRLRDGKPHRGKKRGPQRGTMYHKRPMVIVGRGEEGELLEAKEDISSGEEEHSIHIESPRSEHDVPEMVDIGPEMLAIRRPAIVEPPREARDASASENPPRVRAPPILRREQKLKAAVQPQVPKKITPIQLGQDRKKTALQSKTDQEDEDESDENDARGETAKEEGEIRECYVMSESEDACVCEPDPLEKVRLSKTQRKELNRINALRKLNCAKLNLLKCTLDLKRYQTRVWEADRLNCNGDYLALFGKNPKARLNKIKDITDPVNRDFLKAVLANQTATHRLKKGHQHLQKRLGNQKGKLDKEYTLASMRYDQVIDENSWSNDIFTQKALENREIEPPLPGKITCDSYKIPKIPPMKCPETVKDKPLIDLSQLPKVVPQKAPVDKTATPIPEREPVREPEGELERHAIPALEREAVAVREREPVRHAPVVADVLPEHVPARQVHYAEHIHFDPEHVPPSQQLHIRQPPIVFEELHESPRSDVEQFAHELSRPHSGTRGALESLERSESQVMGRRSEMQEELEVLKDLHREASTAAVARHREHSPSEEEHRPPAVPKSPPSSPKIDRPGSSSPKFDPHGGTGGSGGTSQIMRVGIPMMGPSTPVMTSKDPGTLRESLDREPFELTSSAAVIPPPGSPKGATEKLFEGSLKHPQVVITNDPVLPQTPTKVSIEPITIPPLTLSPVKQQSHEKQVESLTAAYDDEYRRLQRIENIIRQKFRTPLNLDIERSWYKSFFQYKGNILPFLWQRTRGPINISHDRATAMYASLRPLLNQLPWIQQDAPIDEIARITHHDLENAQVAIRVLQRIPAHLSTKHVIDIVHVLAPHRVAGKRGVLQELQNIEIMSAKRKKDLGSRLYKAQEASRVDKMRSRARRRRKRKGSEQKPASGFKSRVGAILKRRKRKQRNPAKKRKPRKKAVKKEVQKQETVVEPKKIIEIPRSPKIKKETKKAGKFPDLVRKRRNKKYLN